MKLLRIAAAGAVALLAWGCLLTPGRFESSLDVRRDGSFTYRYAGEMVFVTPGSDAIEADPYFDADSQVCTGDPGQAAGDQESAGEPRECTSDELAEKRKEWEQGAAARAAQKKQEAEMARAMFGGIDPADSKTLDEFGRRLQGHSGFRRVQHKGKGVFDVDYELSGRLDRDYVFPVFPDVEFVIPFVKVVRLTGNRIRVVAPAFMQAQEGFKAMGSMFQNAGNAASPPKKPEGTFTVTTDAEILTNNTQDGPVRAAGGRTMRWVVGPLDAKRPETLLQL